MSGYSKTPLAKKLGIKPGFRALLVKSPAEVSRELKFELAECRIASSLRGDLDFALLFSESKIGLNREFLRISPLLAPAGMLWVGWPKKTSGVPTDLTENVVRNIGLNAGLVDVKVCAITEVWSGLKFVRRVKDRVPLSKK